MREFLFRGKTEQGEWVEGFYTKGFRYPDEEKLHDMIYMFSVDGKTSNWGFNNATVIPETVGQFTGLTDKNGKKVFEGDIVKFSHPAWEEGYIGVVEYEENEAGFVHRTKEGYELISYDSEFYEVIGNIHDNKELLGE